MMPAGGVAFMRQRRALSCVGLAVAAASVVGCARVMDSRGPLEAQPQAVAAARPLAADWNRLAELRSQFVQRRSLTRVAASTDVPVADPPRSAAGDGSSGPKIPASVLWPKEPWELELDKVVRNICRGC